MKILIRRVSRSYLPYYYNCLDCGAPIMGKDENNRFMGWCESCRLEHHVPSPVRTLRSWNGRLHALRAEK